MQWETVNILAERLGRSRDGKRVAFTLKRGIPFHHGYGVVTAEDVKYSFERAAGIQKLYPNATSSDASFYKGDVAGLERVKVTGKYSGEVIFKEPFAPFFRTTLPYSTSAMLVSKKAVEKLGKKGWLQHPVGTGPYELVSHTPNKEMVLRRFKDYGGAASAIAPSYDWDEIRVMLMPATGLPAGQSATVPLEAGDVDFTWSLRARDVKHLQGNKNLRVYNQLAPVGFYVIFLNVQHPNLRDIRVRQAIRHAIDVPALIALQGESLATRAYAPIGPHLLGYWPEAPRYQRDVDRARHLLQKAGVSSLRVDLAPADKASGELIQSNLGDIGIKTNILLTPPTDYDTNVKKGQLTYTPYTVGPDPYYTFEWFATNQIGIWNFAFWSNKEYDRLLVQLGRELNPQKRAGIAIRMQQLMDESAGFIWVNYTVAHSASSRHVQAIFDANGNPYVQYFQAV